MAVCLTITPAAFAANLPFVGSTTIERLTSVGSHHGLDWNVFITPGLAPLAFLEERSLPEREVNALRPHLPSDTPAPPRPSIEDLESRAFMGIVALIAFMLCGLHFIPRFHAFQARLRSLNIRVPVH